MTEDQSLVGDDTMKDDYRRALLDHGIDPDAEIIAREPMVPSWTASPEELCDQKPESPDAEAESYPMRKLKSVIQTGSSDFPGYKTFISVDTWHPTRGFGIMNTSYEREDGSKTPLGEWVHDRIRDGEVFRVGVFKTSRGYKIIRPVSIKAVTGKAIESPIPF